MKRVLLSACALTTLLATPAFAADSADTNGTTVETLIVTAEKRAQPEIEVPTSLSVVTAKDIQDKNLISVSDISNRLPNVDISGSSLYPQITIRGVTSQVSGGNPGFAPAAAVYVDDVYQGRDRATNLPLSGITQIEVLRGPQGTLYGENTIAGAINISTLKPSDQFVALGDAKVGNLGYYEFDGTVSGPIANNLAASISGVFRHRNGWIHNAFDNVDLNYDHAQGGRLRVIYTPSSQLTIDLRGDYLHEDDTESTLTSDYSTIEALPFPPFNTIPIFNPMTRTESVNAPEYGHRQVYGGSAKIDYDFGGVALTFISAARGYTSSSAFDTDGTPLNIDSETWVNNANQVSEEVRLASTAPSRFQWIVGGYFYHESESSVFHLFIGDQFPTLLLGLPFSLPAGYANTDTETSLVQSTSYAGFASGTFDITSKLRLAGGFRFTEDDKTLHFSQLGTGDTVPISLVDLLLVTIPPRIEHLSNGEPTGEVSLSYKFTDNQVAYVKFARGYKAGGFNVWAVTPPFDPATEKLAFQPEFLSEYEAGFKADYFGGRLQFKSAVFYDDYTNKQEQEENIGAVVPGIVVLNAAKARIYGAEFELDAEPLRGLTLSEALGLLHGTYSSFPDPNGPGTSFTGNDVALAPHVQSSLSAQYERPINGWNDHSFFARIEWNYQSSSFTDPNNTPALENMPYSLINARIGVEGKHWGLFAWGHNLTNTFNLSGGSFLVVDYSRAVNLPRTYGLELSLKY